MRSEICASVGFSTFRLIVAIAELEGAKFGQMDVKSAYIYEKINEEVRILLPMGYNGER